MMNEEEKRLKKLLQGVFNTKEVEIQCEDASLQMIQSAELQLSDEASRQRFPELWHHFHVCSDCLREYRMMYDMIHLEASGELNYPQTIPPLPDRSRSPRWSLKDAISRIFPGFSPTLAPALARGEDMGVEPVEIVFEDQLRLNLDIGIHEADNDLRDLFGNVMVEDEQIEARLEGIQVWLQTGEHGTVLHEETLDELGDFAFVGINPGEYFLRLQIAGKDFVVSNIIAP